MSLQAPAPPFIIWEEEVQVGEETVGGEVKLLQAGRLEWALPPPPPRCF